MSTTAREIMTSSPETVTADLKNVPGLTVFGRERMNHLRRSR